MRLVIAVVLLTFPSAAALACKKKSRCGKEKKLPSTQDVTIDNLFAAPDKPNKPSVPVWTKDKTQSKVWPYHKVAHAEVWVIPRSETDIRKHRRRGDMLMSMKDWQRTGLSSKWTRRMRKSFAALGTDSQMYAKCFFPRQAVVFFNKKNEVVGVSQICFQCDGMRLSHWRGKRLKFGKTAEKKHNATMKQVKKLLQHYKLI